MNYTELLTQTQDHPKVNENIKSIYYNLIISEYRDQDLEEFLQKN